MKRGKKATVVAGLVMLIIILLIIIAVAVAFLFSQGIMKKADPPEKAAETYLNALGEADGQKFSVTTDGKRIYIDGRPSGEEGLLLFDGLQGKWSSRIVSSEKVKKEAEVTVDITCPGVDYLADKTGLYFRENLERFAASASRSAEIYDENLNYKEEIINEAYRNALEKVCSDVDSTGSMTVRAVLKFHYAQRKWNLMNPAVPVNTLDDKAENIRKNVTETAEYIPLKYKIEENLRNGPVPSQNCFGQTNDPNEITALLNSPFAKKLIGNESLCWNTAIEYYPGSMIRYYLDESILMIQWQEVEANMCGTFAEVFVSDGSQLRRKIAGDSFGDMHFMTTSAFAKETNAVLAAGGDFYNHSRNCGVIVFDRQIHRFDPVTCDTCYITADGDLLFSYRNQWTDVSEAQNFVFQNDVVFSLGFGPVLIDNGVDVTPDMYQWGEINDTYARAALGMFGKHHYLVMNLNCGGGQYFNYATLRQAADAMIKRNCTKAYTLDGGQTATMAVNGELVNPVQFGWEKEISDILYFATAVDGNDFSFY